MRTNLQRTPLYDLHVELGGKMVDFAGWEMPVQYGAGIMAEHTQCRQKAALFDVSHMGQVVLRGDDIAHKLEQLVPAALTKLPEGKACYSFFTNQDGGILDDLIISNAGDHFYLVVNASMKAQDLDILAQGLEDVEIEELGDHALIALQGPASEVILAPLFPTAAELTFMQTLLGVYEGQPCRVSRLGYTGEDGFEISVPKDLAIPLAQHLLAHPDCAPAGLGARDTLRLEAGLCLYGNDIDGQTSPIEANLLWAIQKRRREEGGFPGAARILDEIKNGVSRKLVGIRPLGRAPARAGVPIEVDGTAIGAITSGGHGPTIGAPIAMGYVQQDYAAPGTQVQLIVRGKPLPAEVVEMPFVQQNYKR